MTSVTDLRIDLPGVTRPEERFEIDFEGRPLVAYPGESLAAALIAAGEYRFRNEQSGDRGLFCGMGVCGECQVLVNGQSRRACLAKAEPGQVVRRHPRLRVPVANTSAHRDADWETLETDVLVVGGGPAGLCAARGAAAAGLEVVVVDERQQPGGQYYKQPPARFGVEPGRLDRQFVEGIELSNAVADPRIRYLPAVTVVGVFGERDIAVASDNGMLMMHARRIVIATGAYERPLPFPGWTLPGVMTSGAAQTLLRGYQVLPGRRVLVAGNGPLNLQVADELSRAGAEIVAVAELAAPPWRRPFAAARLACHAPSLALAGLGHLHALRRRGVARYHRHALIMAVGDGQVRKATIAAFDPAGALRAGSERHFDVDAVCINYGFLPQSELARALGCTYRRDPATGDVRCERGPDGSTDVPGVFVIGDAGGLGGARLALAQGELAGLSIAADLAGTSGKRRRARLLRAWRRHRRFQGALWSLFAAPDLATALATDDTLVCRCESLPLGTLAQAVAGAAGGLGAVKKLTRAGMGRCQGRYCGATLNALCQSGSNDPDEDFFAPRPPVKPVPVGRLAGRTGHPTEARDLLADVEPGPG